MSLSLLPAALFALALFAPVSVLAQEADSPANQNTCLLNGTHFSKGTTVRLTGERVRCHSNQDGFFWNRDVDGDENSNSFVFCVFEGKFFSQGAIVGDVKCNGNGNWD